MRHDTFTHLYLCLAMLGRLSAVAVHPLAVVCPPQARSAATRACVHVLPRSGSLKAIQHFVFTVLESTRCMLSNAVGIVRFGGVSAGRSCAGLAPAQEDVVACHYFT